MTYTYEQYLEILRKENIQADPWVKEWARLNTLSEESNEKSN